MFALQETCWVYFAYWVLKMSTNWVDMGKKIYDSNDLFKIPVIRLQVRCLNGKCKKWNVYNVSSAILTFALLILHCSVRGSTRIPLMNNQARNSVLPGLHSIPYLIEVSYWNNKNDKNNVEITRKWIRTCNADHFRNLFFELKRSSWRAASMVEKFFKLILFPAKSTELNSHDHRP